MDFIYFSEFPQWEKWGCDFLPCPHFQNAHIWKSLKSVTQKESILHCTRALYIPIHPIWKYKIQTPFPAAWGKLCTANHQNKIQLHCKFFFPHNVLLKILLKGVGQYDLCLSCQPDGLCPPYEFTHMLVLNYKPPESELLGLVYLQSAPQGLSEHDLHVPAKPGHK